MNKKFITAIPFILSILCGIAYQIHGVEIAEDGTLLEAFGFIPMGYLFFFIGCVMLIMKFVRTQFKKA